MSEECSRDKEYYIIGVDIGKTKIEAGAFNLDGGCLKLLKVPSAKTSGLILSTTDSLIQELQRVIDGNISSIGICCFGDVDYHSKKVISSKIVPDWNNIAIGSHFADKYDVPVYAENDVRAALLGDLFYERRIVLVSLNKGLVGSESARLLGSLIVGQLWPLVLSRASVPPERRHIVSIFIDEVQDYLSLPTDLADALSQARGLGVGLTLAHQYRNQLPASLRAGIDSNARNKIVFGLNSQDAEDMARMAPELEATDFMLLPRYGVYTRLNDNGKCTGWISGTTLPPNAALRNPVELKAKSAARYGRNAKEVETEVLAAIGSITAENPPETTGENIGRKKRSR